MRMTFVVLFVMLIAMTGCDGTGYRQRIPAETKLVNAASANGRYEATIASYDAQKMIAVVSTPGWEPETKQYQFDGKKWIPLWSPYAPLDDRR